MASEDRSREKVAEIIRRLDPERMAVFGSDLALLYQDVVDSIMVRLTEVSDGDALAAVIADEFRQEFGYDGVELDIEADVEEVEALPVIFKYSEAELDEIYSADKFRAVAIEVWAAVHGG